MPTTQCTQVTGAKHGSAVHVQTDAAGKVLDEILRKPGTRGQTSVAVQNKRRAIGQHNCKPGAAVIACLQDNGLIEEFVSALRVLLNPGETSFAITDIARHVTKAERALGEPFEELFSGRATSRDYATLSREARVLAEESEALESAAAHVQYVAPLARKSA